MNQRNSDKLRNAIKSLSEALGYSHSPEFQILASEYKNVLQSAVVQNFCLTYKVCVRMIQTQLHDRTGASVAEYTPEELMRNAERAGIINSANRWIEYHKCDQLAKSNLNISQTFDKSSRFLGDAEILLQTCAKRTNDERRRAA
ncbi:MAG: nucleotidyltransferase substrate binding protein [Thermoguttaceae bacterium]